MTDPDVIRPDQRHLLARFWASASGFWSGPSAWRVWLLCLTAISIVIAQLAVQYQLNYWNRHFFDALELRDHAALRYTILLFFPLVAASTLLAVASVWARMTIQRSWRVYLTRRLIVSWLRDRHYRSLGHLNGTDLPRNAEHRISEDARVATDAPVDLSLSLVSSLLTLIVFFQVLANLGGTIVLEGAGLRIAIPGYLAISVLIYSGVVVTVVLVMGRRLTAVIQDQIQAEAAFRSSANLVRESGEGILLRDIEKEDRHELWLGLHNVIEHWRRLCWQLIRITFVSQTNLLLAPVIGLLLCVPKYLAGNMTLGEVTQAAAAFATVQGALNWFVDNFQRMADWRSAASRVAALLLAIDDLKENVKSHGK
ncbi:MAG: ABC transporter [Afipia sp.]|jgi:ABC-type uncharacterized transport system fused permease/ATPase subunit|nr:ABC transporter [Afipia sp.]